MNARTVDVFAASGLHSLHRRLQRLPLRSPVTGQAILLAVHAIGCLLVVAPIVMLIAGAGGALYLFERIQGPLDWFLVEFQIAVSLLGGFLSLQLLAVRPGQPDGVEVTTQQAPELFGMLARRAAHFKIRQINHVLLTTGADLRLVASPILPLPLLHSYRLCVGAPLLFFLSRDQFRLALAGAMAASAKDQSRLTGWLRQACDDWPLIIRALDSKDNLLTRLLATPLRVIAAIAEVLGEALHSDRRVQQGHWVLHNSDERTAVDYLSNQVVATEFLNQHYWPMILKAAERCPTPVIKAFSHLPLLLAKTLTPQLAERWLAQAQTASDRHQSGVPDLLAELKLDHLRWPGLPTPNAFCVLFNAGGLLQQLDRSWQRAIEPEWRLRHACYQNDRSRFERLQRRAATGELRGESAIRYIKLAPRFLDKTDALAACRGAYTSNLDDAKVCFSAGQALLHAGAGQEGGDVLRHAVELDPSFSMRAQALIDEHRQAWIHDDGSTETVIAQDIRA